MKLFITAMLVLGVLSGCGIVDSLTGVKDTDGDGRPDTQDPSKGPAGMTGEALRLAPGPLGWLGMALSTISGIYGAYRLNQRGRLYKEIATGLVGGIDKTMSGGVKLSVTKDEMYSAINEMKSLMSDPGFMTQFISLVKAERRG